MLDGPAVVSALRGEGVTHVVWVPDTELGAWEPALTGPGGLKLIRACREGEAIAIAAGLLLGGVQAVAAIQCTGMFEAGDALRNAVHDLKLPLFLIVGIRSYYLHQHGKSVDSCPVFTEPIVRAWQLPYMLLERRHTGHDLARAYAEARRSRHAFAALIAE